MKNLEQGPKNNYSGEVKLFFCEHLGDSWKNLADFLEIKPHEQARFPQGFEPQAIWEWLERRNRLGELPNALNQIERTDLENKLIHKQQATDQQLGIRLNTLQSYYQKCISRWSAPRYALDARFVDLTLLLDQGPDQPGQRWQAKSEQFQCLRQILAITSEPLVILGAPGSGKSTLLRHYELENAQTALAELKHNPQAAPALTFFIQLNDFKGARLGDPTPLPLAWLSERWCQLNPDLPELLTLMQDGCMTLLLDALNEMPQRSAEVLQLWLDFLAELDACNKTTRVLFSCRFLDYGSQLSVKDRPVFQVRIESLSDDKVRQFLEQYSADHGVSLWNKLKNTAQLDAFRSPYFLKMLIDESVDGEIPSGRAALFTAFVRRLINREIADPNNTLFQAGELLHERDIRRIREHNGKTAYELPNRGLLIPKLCLLAFRMQKHSERQESGQVKIDYDQALAYLDHALGEKLLAAGVAINVLEQDLAQDQVFFTHQLLQEYFAAQHFVLAPEAELAQQLWQADRVTPGLQATLDALPDSDPLPPLPASGWEETFLLAAAMLANADDFIRPLMDANLALAGRCAAQADVTLSEPLKDTLQWALVERSQNPQADLRARIAAGFSLGELGDPRFQTRQGPQGAYLLPPLITIPGGVYRIGSDEGLYDDEAPAHPVILAPFQCGQFPVTNAEWRLFMQAGGYDDECWWRTAEAKAWRRGENTDAGPKLQWREHRKYLQDNFADIREWQRQGKISSKQADFWEQVAQWSDSSFEEWLNEQFPGGRLREPAYWYDNAINQAAQPVVGVCWHEAQAYCAWLSAQSGLSFRLASEAEWEAAARGLSGRVYAYGDRFDSRLANTFESHIRATTPIGVHAGNTAAGLQDMSGNVWEWTTSLYQPYPYDAEDGRENPEGKDGRRVVRGGSWNNNQDGARAAYRDHYTPGNRDNDLGFRLACSSPII